jgi:HPt (histidine-containing phosphotransfer) domain-containing protein
MKSAGQIDAAEGSVLEVLPDRATAAPVDRGYLARFTLGNAALEREILELFAAQMPHYVAQLHAARSSKEWFLAAHTIKGSALAVGAQQLARSAQSAESLDVEADRTDGALERRDAMEAIEAASDEACRFISDLFATR